MRVSDINISQGSLFSNSSVHFISQGSVATRLTCGGIFNDRFTAIILETVPVKKI